MEDGRNQKSSRLQVAHPELMLPVQNAAVTYLPESLEFRPILLSPEPLWIEPEDGRVSISGVRQEGSLVTRKPERIERWTICGNSSRRYVVSIDLFFRSAISELGEWPESHWATPLRLWQLAEDRSTRLSTKEATHFSAPLDCFKIAAHVVASLRSPRIGHDSIHRRRWAPPIVRCDDSK
jgi:hypothetical protein